MRKNMPDSAVIQYPYTNNNGFYQYEEELRGKMEKSLDDMLIKHIDKDRIFHWK
jgi:spore photoproduct lyase